MEYMRHTAGAEYINAVLKQTGMNGTALARAIGVAPSTILKRIKEPEAVSPLGLNTLVKIQSKTGIPFTDAVLRSYNLPEHLGQSRSEQKKMARPTEPADIEEIRTFPLKDGTVLLQLLDAAGLAYQGRVTLEAIRRLRDELQDY